MLLQRRKVAQKRWNNQPKSENNSALKLTINALR